LPRRALQQPEPQEPQPVSPQPALQEPQLAAFERSHNSQVLQKQPRQATEVSWKSSRG